MTELLSLYAKLICRDTRGVTLVEYGIAIALAVTIGSATFALLAGEISTGLTAAGTAMPN